MLVEDGILLDLHPIPPSMHAFAENKDLGVVDEREFFQLVRATERGLQKTVDAGLFTLEAEVELEVIERFDTLRELLETTDEWGNIHLSKRLRARLERAVPPIDLHERLLLHRYRRTRARLPSVFAEIVRSMQPGDVSSVLRSAGGFHVVKLAERRNRNQPTVVDQTHARHILIKVNETTSEAEGRTRIDRLKDRLGGGARFEDLARVNSEDASAARGGDLGWISPGDTVPDFERAMDKLAVNEVSAPIRTPFGWHLIQVLERRKQDVTEERRRDQARQAIRQRKSEEQLEDFIRQLRDRTYVEYKTDER